jgi:uncharacterized protein
VTRAQPGFDADRSLLRTVVTDADHNVGVHALALGAGCISAGDPVNLA